jgi:hypothetical protein
VPAKKLKSRPDENNTYDMQVPGMKSKGAVAATAARVAREAGAAAASVRPPMVDGNNTYDMQVPGMKSKGAVAATAARVAREAGAAAANVRPPMVDGNNTYDMQVPGMKSKGAVAATAARVAREAAAAPAAGGSAPKQQCARPAPAGGMCQKNALPGGGLFCVQHACPECGAEKSSSAPGCPAHMTRPRKQSVYAGFDEGGDADTEA